MLENAVRAVSHLRSLGCNDIEFSPEDATRSEPEFLYRVLAEVIKACPASCEHRALMHCAPHSLCSSCSRVAECCCRSDPHTECSGLLLQAGATTLNIPDTTGWALPHEYGDLYTKLIANVPGADRVVFSTHCQNDLGLATANTLAGAARCACMQQTLPLVAALLVIWCPTLHELGKQEVSN